MATIAVYSQSYTNPVHLVQEISYNQVLNRFDELSKQLEKRAAINDSINYTLIVLREMKNQKISSMSGIPVYYTDPVRIKRFNTKIETTRSIINYCRKQIQKQGKYGFFEKVFEKLEEDLEVVESNWQIVTEFKGKKKLMDAHQRYKLALYAEEELDNISRDAINYSRIASALTRSSDEAADDNKQIMNEILKNKKGIE